MSIVRLFLILSFLVSCAQLDQTSINKCEVTKASFDIGSGSTKMVVARIDRCQEKIINVLYEASRAIELKDHLLKNKNYFRKDFIYHSLDQIAELKSIAQEKGASVFNAVATAAFRSAKNSKYFKNAIKERVQIEVSTINQTTEALIAFNAAKSKAKEQNLVVWDIGGGSMQIVKARNKSKNIYLGKLASVSFKKEVLELLQKKSSPNPLTKPGAIRAMDYARKYAGESAKEIIGDIKDLYVVGVGGVHFYSIRNQTGKNPYYTQNDLLNALLERSKLTDKQVGGEYASTDVTNLALVLGYMQALGIERVHPMKVNMAHGILLSP